MSTEPRLEIEVTEKGVRAVRVFGDGWEQSQRALMLLNRVQPLVKALDGAARGDIQTPDTKPGRLTQ
ncbi:MAG: hypothetical protein L0387_11685 [Acidobacteria bacterium]|nr:hypothetical protein [Acidobacteriota bacterium]MCI0723067.1 hypothetical protein [Acidobacteriota bacterium]